MTFSKEGLPNVISETDITLLYDPFKRVCAYLLVTDRLGNSPPTKYLNRSISTFVTIVL